MIAIGFVLFVIYAFCTLWLMITTAAQLHLFWHSRKTKREIAKGLPAVLPAVTVQVPLYNEKFVVEGLLESLAALSYPRELLEIQVLDDSTDETSRLIDAKFPLLRAGGATVNVLRRTNRKGYKAGALTNGMSHCNGEFIAIFDADFRPPADFLLRMLPAFSDERVGLVQARWGHVNSDQNFLTRIQTLLLDMHFSVEQAGRYNAGYFVNFCGTAGIWRKQCIEDAGGWDGDVLSEDLDLSYRAQTKGWKLVFDNDLQVPAQLPADLEAFKTQQFRWTKGTAQTARKMLSRLWQSPVSIGQKIHGSFHLFSSLAFVCMFVNAVLAVPLFQLRHHYPEFVTLTNYMAVGALNLLALAFLYYKSASANPDRRGLFFLHYPVFVVVYLAMSVQNSIAVWQGFAGKASPFVRTPKRAFVTTLGPSYAETKWTWINGLEAMWLTYFLYATGLSIYWGEYFMLVFFVLICAGLCVLLAGAVASLFKAVRLSAAVRQWVPPQRPA